jgi:hypothetical protein
MSTTVNVTATNDGHVSCVATPTWAAARDATTGTAVSSADIEIVRNVGGTTYNCRRGFLQFAYDIGTGKAVTGVTLYLNGDNDGSTTDFDIYVVQGTQTGALSTAAYNDFSGCVVGGVHTPTYYSGAWNTSSFSSGWNTIAFNAAGIAAVMAANGGTLSICLLNKDCDIDNVAPVANSYVTFDTSADVGTEPYLAITYLDSVSKTVSVTVEMETAGTGTKKLAKSVSVTTEAESSAPRHLKKSVSSTVEMECVGTGHCGIYKAAAALIEMEAAATYACGSTMRILLEKIIDLADKEVNDGVKVNNMIREIVTKFNRVYNTTYGHDHGGDNSKYISSTVSEIALQDIAVMQLLDLFKRGG